MDLWNTPPNTTVKIERVLAELPPAYAERLRELGFHVGEEIECLRHAPMGGPRLYRVQNSVYALDHDVAKYLDVSEVHHHA